MLTTPHTRALVWSVGMQMVGVQLTDVEQEATGAKATRRAVDEPSTRPTPTARGRGTRRYQVVYHESGSAQRERRL